MPPRSRPTRALYPTDGLSLPTGLGRLPPARGVTGEGSAQGRARPGQAGGGHLSRCAHPASPAWCRSSPRRGGLSGSPTGSDWPQVTQPGEGGRGRPGRLAPGPALSNVPHQTSRQRCSIGCEGGASGPTTNLHPELPPQAPLRGSLPAKPKSSSAREANPGSYPPGSAKVDGGSATGGLGEDAQRRRPHTSDAEGRSRVKTSGHVSRV